MGGKIAKLQGDVAKLIASGSFALSSFAASASYTYAEQARLSFDFAKGDHLGFETGELLDPQTLSFFGGTLMGERGLAGGTGRQYYGGEFRWRGESNLEYGLALQVYDDPPYAPIDGSGGNVTLLSFGPSIKFLVFSNESFSISAQAAAEVMLYRADFLGTANSSDGRLSSGALQTSLTYALGERVQLHATAGATYFPEEVAGEDFFGTFTHAGAGLTWTPTRNLQFYATAQEVFGPGGNAFLADGSIGQSAVWSVGARYAVSEYASGELYVTNGTGFSPATALLADIPGSSEPLFGIRFNYLPSIGPRLDRRFEEASGSRGRPLHLDGLGLNTGKTLPPATFQSVLTVGGNGQKSAYIAAAHDPGVQFEAIIEEFANDGSVSEGLVPEFERRLTFGGRMRLVTTDGENPVTATARLLAGQDLTVPTTGVFYGALPVTYEHSDALILHFDPRFAAFGSRRTAGIGLGANLRVSDSAQLLFEVTPVFQSELTVWSVGARYGFEKLPLSVEVFATNAIGRYGLGTLVAQDSPRLGIGVTWLN